VPAGLPPLPVPPAAAPPAAPAAAAKQAAAAAAAAAAGGGGDPRFAKCGFAKLLGDNGLEYYIKKYEVVMGRKSKVAGFDGNQICQVVWYRDALCGMILPAVVRIVCKLNACGLIASAAAAAAAADSR
jgi:hypothetical protein